MKQIFPSRLALFLFVLFAYLQPFNLHADTLILEYEQNYFGCNWQGSCFEGEGYIDGGFTTDCPQGLKFTFKAYFQGTNEEIWSAVSGFPEFDIFAPLGYYDGVVTAVNSCGDSATATFTILLDICGPPFSTTASSFKQWVTDPDTQFVVTAIDDIYSGDIDCLQGGYIDSLRIERKEDVTGEPPSTDTLYFSMADTGYNEIVLWEYSWGIWQQVGSTYLNIYVPFDTTISGTIYYDQNKNCHQDEGEFGIANREVYLYTTNNRKEVDSLGQYLWPYETPTSPFNQYVSGIVTTHSTGCPTDTIFSNASLMEGSLEMDYGIQLLDSCSELHVDIAAPFLRRCFDNVYYVNYCNSGLDTASDAFVEIDFDPFLNILSSSIPWTTINGNTYTFPLGDVPGGACGSFQVFVNVDCETTVPGQSHCTTAHIYPDETCQDTTGLWGGGNIEVRTECGETSVNVIIKNTGQAATTQSLEYFIVEDDIIIFLNSIDPLNPGDSILHSYPKDGSYYYAQSEQEPFHPFNTSPSSFIEGCATGADTISTGFNGQFPLNDPEPFLDMECQDNVGSFDPNDKSASPTGYTASHYMKPGEDIDYTIRFQNTGTDTAFTVRIVDTLSSHLLIGSFEPGVGSHDFTSHISPDGIVEFLFENIALPDSNVNEVASHGFIRFSIKIKEDVPASTLIENQAAIYFDFNEPVITNTVFHNIREDFINLIFSDIPPAAGPKGLWQVDVFPNPVSEMINIHAMHPTRMQTLDLHIVDVLGRQMGVYTSDENGAFSLNVSKWHAGVYFYEIQGEGVYRFAGSFVVK